MLKHRFHLAILYILLFGAVITIIDRTVFRMNFTFDQCTIYQPHNGKLPSAWDSYGKYKGG